MPDKQVVTIYTDGACSPNPGPGGWAALLRFGGHEKELTGCEPARNWKRKGGALANVDLWQALDAALRSHEISWHWVRGHAGNRDNQRVDRLAREAICRS